MVDATRGVVMIFSRLFDRMTRSCEPVEQLLVKYLYEKTTKTHAASSIFHTVLRALSRIRTAPKHHADLR